MVLLYAISVRIMPVVYKYCARRVKRRSDPDLVLIGKLYVDSGIGARPLNPSLNPPHFVEREAGQRGGQAVGKGETREGYA
jgi:hypothetical protein